MTYIREKKEERTGIQISSPPSDSIDNQCDFVMVYGIDNTTLKRIENFKKKGYVIHLMTGIAWGNYLDYFNGEYDGIKHWDEGQTDRYGNPILHGPDCPYMCPTITFADYLTDSMADEPLFL